MTKLNPITSDLKGEIINQIYGLLKIYSSDEFEIKSKFKPKLILLTNFGRIEGNPLITGLEEYNRCNKSKDANDNFLDNISSQIDEIRNGILQDTGKQNPEEYPSVLSLKDVTIIPHNDKKESYTLDNLNVFTDQIVGFTIKSSFAHTR